MRRFQRRRAVPVLAAILAYALTLLPAAGTSLASADTTLALNGAPLAAETYPLYNDDALVALRPVAEALGAAVAWNPARREVTIARGPRTIVLAIGRTWAGVDGGRVPLDTPAILVGGRTLAPLRFLAAQLGAAVRWDPAGRTFTLTAGPAATPSAAPPAARDARPQPAPTAATPAPTAGAPAAPPGGAPPRGGRRLVLGYAPVDYPGDRTAQLSLERHPDAIDLVVYFGLHLDGSGNLTPTAGGESRGLEAAAARGGKGLLAAVHNVYGSGFDRDAVHALLADPAARARAVENIHRLVRGRYRGVNLDLENLYPSDREAYTAFVRQVADRLRPEGYLVTLAVPAKTADDRRDGWSGAYDYDALGRIADYLVIMSYDEHWPGGPAGPIASIGWVERVARYAAAHIPPEKILLGVPAYGYDWPASGGAAQGLSAPGAVRRAASVGARIRWDGAAQVPYFTYWDARGARHTVYFENASSLAAKVDVVSRLRLAGIALWRLGHEDPAAWEGVIRGKLKPPAAG